MSFNLAATTGVFDHVDKRGLEMTGASAYNVQTDVVRGILQKKEVLDCAVVSGDGKTWTFMNGHEWRWMDEEAFGELQKETDPAGELPNDYSPGQEPGRLVWITGGTGMGKTTTSRYLKELRLE